MNTYLLSATLSILEMVKGAPWLTMDTFLYLFNFSYIGIFILLSCNIVRIYILQEVGLFLWTDLFSYI